MECIKQGSVRSHTELNFALIKKGKSLLWLIVGHTAIQRIPGTSHFVPHDSRLPVNSLYDRIAIPGHGPEFKACRQLLQPRIRFRNVVDTGDEEIVGVSRDSTKKRLFEI